MRGHSAVRIAASVKSGTAIEHAVNSVVTESVNIHNHSEVIQSVNYGFSCWQAYRVQRSQQAPGGLPTTDACGADASEDGRRTARWHGLWRLLLISNNRHKPGTV